MISQIIQKEWTEYQQGKHTKWVVTIIYILFSIALATGIFYYHQSFHSSKNAQDASYKQWLAQGKKNPHSAAHYGFYVYKPLSPLAIMDKGMEGYLGQAVWLEAHNQNEVKEREANDAGSIVRFGNLTVAFVFQFLMPLAIILLGFDMFSKEKEYGTLPLLLTSSASIWQIFIAKAMALYRLVVFIFLSMFGLAIMSIFFVAGLHLGVQVLPSAIFLLLGYLLYFAIWVLLALYISSLVRQSSVALVCLLAFWVFNTFFITRIGGLMANSLVNLPSSFQFSHNIRLDNELGLDRKTPATMRQKKFEDSLLQYYGVGSLSQLPLNIRGLNLQKSEEYGYRIFEKNYGQLEADYLKQDVILTKLNLLSPAQSMRSISAGVSGTDINKHLYFAQQAELHRRLIAQTMNNDIARNSAGIENYEVSPDFWKRVPPFYYREKELGDSIAQQWMSIISLLVWLLALCLLLKCRAKKITGLP